METATERPPVYFCHSCTTRVAATRTATQELQCRQCGHTFVEELTQSVVGTETLGEPPVGSFEDGNGARSEGATLLQAFGIVGGLIAGQAGETTVARSSSAQSSVSASASASASASGSGLSSTSGARIGGRLSRVTPRSGERIGDDEDDDNHAARTSLRSSVSGQSGGSSMTGDLRSSSSTSARTLRARRIRPMGGASGGQESRSGASGSSEGSGAGAGGGARAGFSDGARAAATAAGEAAAAAVAEANQANIATGMEQLVEQLFGVGGGGIVAHQVSRRGESSGQGGRANERDGAAEEGTEGRRDEGAGAVAGAGAGAGGAEGGPTSGARAARGSTRGSTSGARGRAAAGGASDQFLGSLIQALGGRGSGHTEIFIGPNMQRVTTTTGRGEGGVAGGGGGAGGLASLGLLLRGFGVQGGLAEGLGVTGNVGDYAFGDLSNVLQQLMAADTNRHGPPPASKEVVQNLPTIEVTREGALEGQECAVCKDDFSTGDTARELPCKHAFHEQCILPWVAERNTCPTCRHELPTDENFDEDIINEHDEENTSNSNAAGRTGGSDRGRLNSPLRRTRRAGANSGSGAGSGAGNSEDDGRAGVPTESEGGSDEGGAPDSAR